MPLFVVLRVGGLVEGVVHVHVLLLREHTIFMCCYLVNTLYSWSLFHEQKDLLECTMDSLFIYFCFLSSPVLPLRYFLSPELASVRLPRVCLCCHLCGSGIPTIHSHFADPFGVGRLSFCVEGRSRRDSFLRSLSNAYCILGLHWT